MMPRFTDLMDQGRVVLPMDFNDGVPKPPARFGPGFASPFPEQCRE